MDEIIREGISEWQARDRSAAYNTALICASLYNCHRDPKQHPQPFTPADFLPSQQVEREEPAAPVVAAKVTSAMRILQALNK